MRNVIGQSFFYGSDAPRDHRAAATSRVPVNSAVAGGCAKRASPAGRSPRFRLRRTCQRERGEPIVGSQYACSKRNIGTTL
ncbi:hypothetical protein FFI87_027995 [Burkholderia sp. KBS0801]|nr:hypothetical protein FFI87_027995 [Burkholderia sp. KBS0801]